MAEHEPFTWRKQGPFDPAVAGELLSKLGHGGFLGMRYGDHGPDWFEAELPWREDLVGAGNNGVLASGPIISLFDNCTSMAIWTRRGCFVPHVTLDLRIDYVRAAVPGRSVIARAECYQLRGDLAFVRALAHDGDMADPLAHAAAIFMVLGDSE
ncbi:uncharacterized protein (TIGR00369 family) [Novosphingobium capsulatum]|uniref:Uncharacterized protein (TIGR00369 family) n=1 Tax=Novosphingobium capsulatum TaxID=13688 RepID=A0ABU1MTB7_9SPHN|nr:MULTISPECIES: PaaI family thioesterase [Novosphingobium]MBB3359847.1 uncharacterized protein (TIGR00369 family) [Novosphingobium sp. BK256]MBB3376206.1 uncharacterized protein (TIGR00369 family) [Novosphingobium sp. BK280]MBB3380620.1 uncharacterized protein (TIGR00369 family) [Novosphingobium sp. BK258]MBB3422271.1 uncharacterized protein (TIGR00369 family) [Novosphingobium sp. BK267]MBB3450873.1 uncharacterized protein (TIGR00369 family) [Novosphingobium sp. BK352]